MDDYDEIRKHLVEKAIAENDGTTVDFILPENLSRKIEGYMSMSEDLELCLYALAQFELEISDQNQLLCLHYTLITLYGKCFMDATKNQYPKLEANDCFAASPNYLKTHAELIELRHHFIAHRGKSLNEAFLPIFQINIINHDQAIKMKMIKKSAPNNKKILAYKEIIIHLLKLIDVKREKAISKAYKHLTQNYTPEKMHELLLKNNS